MAAEHPRFRAWGVVRRSVLSGSLLLGGAGLSLTGCGGSAPEAAPPEKPAEPAAAKTPAAQPTLDPVRTLYEQQQYAEALTACDRYLTAQPRDAGGLLLRARIHRAMQNNTAARTDCDNALQAAPDSARRAELLQLRGQLRVEEKQYSEALADFNEAVELTGGSYSLWLERGLLHGLMRNSPAAIQDFTAAVNKDPRSHVALSWRGREYFAQGEFDKAIKDLKDALFLKPDEPAYLEARADVYAQLGELDKAFADYQQAITLKPDRAFTYYLRGNLRAATGETEPALDDLRRAIELDPQQPDYRLSRAQQYAELGETESALADFDEAIRLAPGNPRLLHQRGLFHLANDNLDAAVADLTSAVQVNAEYAPAYALRGTIYRDQGKTELSLQDFDRLLKLNPGQLQPIIEQAWTWLAAERPDEAEKLLTQAISRHREFAEGYQMRSIARAQQGKGQEAADDLNAAIRLAPERIDFLLERARLYRSVKQLDLALQDIQKAVSLQPQNDDVLHERALVAFQQEDYEAAMRDLRKAMELNAENPEHPGLYADILCARQQYATAIDFYTKAIQLSPTTPDYYESRAVAYSETGKNDLAEADLKKAEEYRQPASPTE